MASFEKLPSGRFRGIYYDHREKKRVPGTFRLQSEALNAAKDKEAKARRRAQKAAGTLPATITWGKWWEILSADRHFESDTKDVERRLVKNHLAPQWESVPLNEIDRRSVQHWVNDLRRRRTPRGTIYKPSYVRRIYNVFAMSINAAISHDPPVLEVSPLVRIKLPKAQRKTKKQFLPVDDVPKLGEHLREDYADVVAFGMETGLRPGELAGLHDDQVDAAGMVLWVTTVFVQRARKMRSRPKDDDARLVPLSERALTIYRRRTAGRDMRLPCGADHYAGRCTCDVVFRTLRGAILDSAKLGEAMWRAADKAKLPGRSGYALRRGLATRLARGGIDLFELMDIMGWSDPALAREYVQQSPGTRYRFLSALEDPAARTLRVVGQPADRGTEHGTELDSPRQEHTHKQVRRNTS